MNIFKPFTLRWWQTGLFKLLLLSLGIIIGATWPAVFHAWLPALAVLFVLPAIYITWIWWKQ